MQIPDTVVYQMSWHIWPLKPYYDFWATMYSFCFSLFLFILISSWVQIKCCCCCCCCCAPPTSPKVNKWISYKCWHFQLVMSIDLVKLFSLLVTGLLKVAKTHHLLCDVICLLSYQFTCSLFFNKILQNQLPTHRAAFNTSTLCDHLVGNIIYTSTTDSYDDLMWLYFYFL